MEKTIKKIASLILGAALLSTLVLPATVLAGPVVELDVKALNYTQNANGSWSDEVSANLGDDVLYLIGVKNVGSETLTGIGVKMSLPGGLTLVNSSTKLYLGSATSLLPNTINSTGVSVPDLSSGSNLYVVAKTKVASSAFALSANPLKVAVTLTASGGISITDSATNINVSTSGGSGTTGSLSLAMTALNYTQNPNGSWTKSISAQGSEEVLVAMNIKNTGTVNATGINAKVTLPSGLSRVDNFTKLYQGSNVTILPNTIDTNGVSVPDLTPGSNVYVTAKLKVASSGLSSGASLSVVSQVTASGGISVSDSISVNITSPGATNDNDNGASVTSGATTITLSADALNYTQNPNGSWTKSISAQGSEEVLVAMNIKNTGTVNATGINAKVTLPSGLSRVDNFTKLYQGSNVTILPNTIDTNGVSVPDLTPGSNVYVTAKLKVASSGLSSGQSLTISTRVIASNADTRSDNVTVTISSSDSSNQQPASPSLSIYSEVLNYTQNKNGSWAKTANARMGDEVVYSMNLKNDSNTATSGIRVYAALPSGLSLVDNFTKLYHGNQVTFLENTIDRSGGVSIGLDLPARSNYYVTFKAKVASSGLSSGSTLRVTHRATASGNISVSDNTTVVIEATTSEPRLTVDAKILNYTRNASGSWAKTASAQPGDEVLYSLNITNTGTVNASGINVAAILVPGLARVNGLTKLYIGAETRILPDTIDTTGVSIPDLTPGSNVYVTFKVKVANDSSLIGKELRVSNRVLANNFAAIYDNSTVLNIVGAGTSQPPQNPPSPQTGNSSSPISTGKLPSTGMPVLATILLSLLLFAAISGFVYWKEYKALRLAISSVGRGENLNNRSCSEEAAMVETLNQESQQN